MKTETMYVCETCGSSYRQKEAAESCEARDKPERPPRGLLIAGDAVDFYNDKLAFAVAKTDVDGHYVHVSLWACQDTPMPCKPPFEEVKMMLKAGERAKHRKCRVCGEQLFFALKRNKLKLLSCGCRPPGASREVGLRWEELATLHEG